MIFQHTWEKVLSGKKSQTRRIVKNGEWLTDDKQQVYKSAFDDVEFDDMGNLWADNSRQMLRYEIGRTYAVQPRRGAKAAGRIKLLSIGREDVRHIEKASVLAEGFDSSFAFLWTWCIMHDPEAVKMLLESEQMPEAPFHIPRWLFDRPAAKYDAWVLRFELVQEATHAS